MANVKKDNHVTMSFHFSDFVGSEKRGSDVVNKKVAHFFLNDCEWSKFSEVLDICFSRHWLQRMLGNGNVCGDLVTQIFFCSLGPKKCVESAC